MRSFLFALSLLLCSNTFAQDSTRVLVNGTVTHSISHRPVHCTVELFDANGVKLGVTDVNSDGRYGLLVPTGVKLELRIDQQGYAKLRVPFGPGAAGTRTFGLDLVLVPASSDER